MSDYAKARGTNNDNNNNNNKNNDSNNNNSNNNNNNNNTNNTTVQMSKGILKLNHSNISCRPTFSTRVPSKSLRVNSDAMDAPTRKGFSIDRGRPCFLFRRPSCNRVRDAVAALQNTLT